MSESSEQQVVIHWREIHKGEYPALALLHSIPNGAHMHVKMAQRMVLEGLTRGIPDLSLPYPARRYHGLYIELKVGRNKPSPEQKLILEELSRLGYRVQVCYSANQAVQVIHDYLMMQCTCAVCQELIGLPGDFV